MTKRRVFEATASDGTVFKRTTDRGRTYTHCVIVWCAATPEVIGKFHTWPARPAGWARSAEWASRLDLAEKNARSWNARADSRGASYRAEILEAREVTKPTPGDRFLEQLKEQERLDGNAANQLKHFRG